MELLHAWLNLGAQAMANGTGLTVATGFSVMINFMYQLEWPQYLVIILGVFVVCF